MSDHPTASDAIAARRTAGQPGPATPHETDRARFVTLVIPEFVVRKWWHRFLHNQTALTLKGTFLFEPSVVVSAVPYRL